MIYVSNKLHKRGSSKQPNNKKIANSLLRLIITFQSIAKSKKHLNKVHSAKKATISFPFSAI